MSFLLLKFSVSTKAVPHFLFRFSRGERLPQHSGVLGIAQPFERIVLIIFFFQKLSRSWLRNKVDLGGQDSSTFPKTRTFKRLSSQSF